MGISETAPAATSRRLGTLRFASSKRFGNSRVLSRCEVQMRSNAWRFEDAAPSPLAGHAVNPSMGARWRHPCRQRSRKRRGHRTRPFAGVFTEERNHCVARFRSGWLLCRNPEHRPTRLVLARPPSRDPWRHGCRHGAYRDVLAACPAMVGGQGPCSRREDLEGAVPSPLAGHAVNPSMEARWRHPCRHTVPQAARTPHQTVGWCFTEERNHRVLRLGVAGC